MPNLETQLRPFAESLLEPGETLLGCCVASRQVRLKGWMVAVVVTAERLVLQRLRKSGDFEADGEPLVLTADTIAGARAGAGGGWGATPSAAIMDRASVQLKLRTTDGERIKLMMMRGEGPMLLGKLGGGEIQREGVLAIGAWFERHAVA